MIVIELYVWPNIYFRYKQKTVYNKKDYYTN